MYLQEVLEYLAERPDVQLAVKSITRVGNHSLSLLPGPALSWLPELAFSTCNGRLKSLFFPSSIDILMMNTAIII